MTYTRDIEMHSDDYYIQLAIPMLEANIEPTDVKKYIQDYRFMHIEEKLTDEQLDKIIELANFMRI